MAGVKAVSEKRYLDIFGPLLDGYFFSLSGIFLVTLTRICTDDVFGTDYFQKLGLTKIE